MNKIGILAIVLLAAAMIAPPALAATIPAPYASVYYNMGVIKTLGSAGNAYYSSNPYEACVEDAKTKILYNTLRRQSVKLKDLMTEYNTAIKQCYKDTHYVGNPYVLGSSVMASTPVQRMNYNVCMSIKQEEIAESMRQETGGAERFYGRNTQASRYGTWISMYNEARSYCSQFR